MEFKVIIAGGRDFNDFDMLKSSVDKLLKNVDKSKNDIIIVSGKAKGADSLGEKYAKINVQILLLKNVMTNGQTL